MSQARRRPPNPRNLLLLLAIVVVPGLARAQGAEGGRRFE